MAHTKKHTMRQNIAKSQLKVRQNRPPTRKRTPFSKTEYLWPDGKYRNQRPPLQSKGLASNKKVEKKVNKVEKKVNKVEKSKYKQVSQKELDTKVKEMSKPKESKPKKKMHAIEKRNRERFGDAHVDKLKADYAKFKANRKKKKNKLKVGG